MSSRTLRRPAPQQLWPRGASGPAGTLLLDLISVQATNAYSSYRKLRTNYAGAAFRVRRTVPDSAEQDIGFAGDLVDTAALLTFVGAGSGYVVTLYDQSGNGRDLIQAAPAAQPRIVNAGVLETYPSGRIAMSFDGVDDRLRRAVAGNCTGLAGSPNITAGSAFQILSPNAIAWSFGAAVTGAAQITALQRATTAPGSIRKAHGGADAFRNFTLTAGADTAGHGYVVQHTAGATTHTGTVRQNGVNLAPGTTGPTALALNLVDNNLELGNNNFSSSVWMQGKLNAFVLFNAVLAGPDLATLEAELAAHVIAPPSLDNISVPALVAVSSARKLRTAYAGPCLRVRRSSDNTEQDIGFVSGALDTAALLAFVGAGSGYVSAVYDQSGNGRDLIQTTLAWQPRIVNAGVLETYPGGGVAMSFDGTDDRLRRSVPGNSCGLSGNPAFTAGTVFQCFGTDSADPWSFGSSNTTVGSKSTFWRSPGTGTVQTAHYGSARAFTLTTNETVAGHSYVMQHSAGADTHSSTLRQNGAALTPGATVGSALVLNMPDDNCELGTDSASGDVAMQGRLNCALLFGAVLTGADLAALEAELAAHR